MVFISPFNDEIDNESFLDSVVRHILEAVGIRTASADDLIKRVVAVGGDTVEVKGGYLLHQRSAGRRALPCCRTGLMPDFSAVVVPPENVFVMGDNRGVSYDSRQVRTNPRRGPARRGSGSHLAAVAIGSIDSVTISQ